MVLSRYGIEKKKELNQLNESAAQMSEDSSLFEVENTISNALKLAGLDDVRQLYLRFRSSFIGTEKQIESPNNFVTTQAGEQVQQLPKLPSLPVQEQISASLNQSFTKSLKLLKDKAFTHGVIMDVPVDKDIQILCSEEGLDQITYTLLDFCTQASIAHNQGRKISLRAKSLGDIAYLKLFISNYCLNADELEFFQVLALKNQTLWV